MNLTESEIAEFEARLLQHAADLANEDASSGDNRRIVELDQQSVGRLSRMDALQQQAMSKAQQDRRQVQQKRIQLALARIADGEFGFCTDCGDPVERRRLDLDPTTPLCLDCSKG